MRVLSTNLQDASDALVFGKEQIEEAYYWIEKAKTDIASVEEEARLLRLEVEALLSDNQSLQEEVYDLIQEREDGLKNYD